MIFYIQIQDFKDPNIPRYNFDYTNTQLYTLVGYRLPAAMKKKHFTLRVTSSGLTLRWQFPLF